MTLLFSLRWSRWMENEKTFRRIWRRGFQYPIPHEVFSLKTETIHLGISRGKCSFLFLFLTGRDKTVFWPFYKSHGQFPLQCDSPVSVVLQSIFHPSIFTFAPQETLNSAVNRAYCVLSHSLLGYFSLNRESCLSQPPREQAFIENFPSSPKIPRGMSHLAQPVIRDCLAGMNKHDDAASSATPIREAPSDWFLNSRGG